MTAKRLNFKLLTTLIVARVSGETGETIAGTARAADGDTLTLDGHRIRLLGIDTPGDIGPGQEMD